MTMYAPNTVVIGNPARVICTVEEYKVKRTAMMRKHPVYDVSYSMRGRITDEKNKQMQQDLSHTGGYVV